MLNLSSLHLRCILKHANSTDVRYRYSTTLPHFLFLFIFFPRPSMNLRQNNIKNVPMITWKFLMVKVKNHQFWDAYVAIRYQILLLLLEIKCLFALFLMHQFKERAFKQRTLQVRKSGCGLLIISPSFFSRRYSCIYFLLTG